MLHWFAIINRHAGTGTQAAAEVEKIIYICIYMALMITFLSGNDILKWNEIRSLQHCTQIYIYIYSLAILLLLDCPILFQRNALWVYDALCYEGCGHNFSSYPQLLPIYCLTQKSKRNLKLWFHLIHYYMMSY